MKNILGILILPIAMVFVVIGLVLLQIKVLTCLCITKS